MKTHRLAWADRLLVALAALVTFLFVAWGAQSDTAPSGPNRAALLEMAKKFPHAASLDAEGSIDDILALGPTKIEAEVMLMQGYFESGWGKWVLGDCTCKNADGSVDNCPRYADRSVNKCTAFGAMQTTDPHKWIPGATPSKVIADRKLGYDVGLRIFRWTMGKCGGDVRKALGLYFSGIGCGVAQGKVAYRCKYVGC